MVLRLRAGNDNIHQLTTTVRQKLRVELEDFEGNKTYAQYNDFLVGSEEEQYKLLMIGTYNGTAGQCDVETSTEFFYSRNIGLYAVNWLFNFIEIAKLFATPSNILQV